MKRNYISPEFKYTKVSGTFNMLEDKTFFGSKMLDIEDEIIINSRDIVYYQDTNKEQENLTNEKLLPPVIYSMVKDKEKNHKLLIDEYQSKFEKLNNTRWILEIELDQILRNYIFSQLKYSRVFEGVVSSETMNNNINQSIYDYIDLNVLDRYVFDKIDLFIEYKSLIEYGNYQSMEIPMEMLLNDKRSSGTSPMGDDIDISFLDNNGNNYSQYIASNGNIETKIHSSTNSDKSVLISKFKQSKKRSEYSFDYYFNIIFKKK